MFNTTFVFFYLYQSECILDILSKVGKGNENCTEPKKLSENVWSKVDILDIAWFNVSTFSNENYNFDNETYKELHWNTSEHKIYKNGGGICFTVTLPDNIISQGIKRVILKVKSKSKAKVIY